MPTSTRSSRARRAGAALTAGFVALLAPAPATATADEAAVPASSAKAAKAAKAAKVVKLPPPTGKRPIGTVSLHLVDRSRPDPWVAARPYRELMVSLWYPARRSAGLPLAPHMQPLAAADFDQTLAPALLGTKPGEVDWAATMTHARVGAPVDRRAGRLPVVLFSAGFGGPRTVGTALVEDLASRGYVVVSVDHTHEAAQVEFPGGRVERSIFPPQPTQEAMTKALSVRVADLRFVLDQVARLDRGRNPDDGRGPLPAGLRGGLDLSRTGALGHSMGGAGAAQLMYEDRRVDAGVNLDGGHRGSVAQAGLARPFLQVAAEAHTRASDPTWRSFWDSSSGWKRELRFGGAGHYTFTDAVAIAPQLTGKPTEDRALAAQRAYVAAFFDLHLKGRSTSLFERPARRYPQVKLIP